jgi:DUF4097 and DUF4098 domain-containing protein YvlB
MTKFYVSLFLTLTLCLSCKAQERRSLTAPLATVEIEQNSGDISIVESSSESYVEWNKKVFGETCNFEINEKGSSLFIVNEQRGFSDHEPCTVDIKVHLKAIKNISIRSGSDSILAEAASPAADITLGNGDVSLKGGVQKAAIKIGNGNVHITLINPPKEGALSAVTGSGNVHITSPKSFALQATAVTGLGQIKNLPTANASAYKADFKVGNGDVVFE